MAYARVALLLAAMTALFLLVGYLIGGQGGMIVALGLAVAMNGFTWWKSDRMVLGMYGAEEVDRQSAPALYGIVEQLATRAGLPMPRVYIIESPQPNAFATGRNPDHAAVAATTGILRMLDHRELAGVMAHELAHVKNRDTLTMTITATIAGAIGMLANFGLFFGGGRNTEGGGSPLGLIGTVVMAILAPLAAMLVQMAISRSNEYSADRAGAEICGNPLWLASALAKLDRGARELPNLIAERNPATAHLFIVNPLHGGRMDTLFSTHPDMDNRIRRLEDMAGSGLVGRTPAWPSRQTGPWG